MHDKKNKARALEANGSKGRIKSLVGNVLNNPPFHNPSRTPSLMRLAPSKVKKKPISNIVPRQDLASGLGIDL